MMKRRAMKRALLVLGLAALSLGAWGQDEAPAADEFSAKLEPGFYFGMNPLALMGKTLDCSESYYANFWGRRLTGFTLNFKGIYGDGFRFRDNDGLRIDAFGPDARYATWEQLQGIATLSASQGLLPSRDPDCWQRDLLALSLSYSGRYTHKLDGRSPEAWIRSSGRPDAAADLFQNKLTLSLDLNDYRTDKLFNTREGCVGSLSLSAAPRGFLNDALGLSDYAKFCLDVRNYLPLVKDRAFSMYASENASYDVAWGPFLPAEDAFSMASKGQPVRAVGFYAYDGFSHLTHQLELRMSFPSLLDSGVMPGFSFFYDCGLYDDYDYVFGFDRFAQAAGAAFVMHMDSVAILPFSAQLDIQTGLSYDFGREKTAFYWNMFFPNDISL